MEEKVKQTGVFTSGGNLTRLLDRNYLSYVQMIARLIDKLELSPEGAAQALTPYEIAAKEKGK